MEGLGTLGDESYAYGVSADGSVIVGYSNNGMFDEAFRWTEGPGMEGLGTLGGGYSYAYGVSADGAVIVGESEDANGDNYAFYWTAQSLMQKLLFMVNADSYASAVNADGSVVVGYTRMGGDEGVAFRWTESAGLEKLSDILIAGDVDISDWDLTIANAVSANGNIIAGQGYYQGDRTNFIMNAVVAGIITPEELAESLQETTMPVRQAQAGVASVLGQSLLIARNAISTYFPKVYSAPNDLDDVSSLTEQGLQDIAPAAGGDEKIQRAAHRKALYATGALGVGQNDNFSNHGGIGATGALVEVAEGVVVGGGVIGGYAREEARLGGQSRTSVAGGSVMASFEGPTGLRLYSAATAATLNVSTDRHYMSGATVDGSSGDTKGTGYAVAAKAGYEFELYEGARVMPYIEGDFSHVRLDAYTERGGAFPAAAAAQKENYIASRVGVEISHDITSKLTMRGRTAWGHRYTDGGAAVSTVAAMTQSVPGDAGERDWFEFGLNGNYRLTERTTLTTDLGGRVGRTAEPAVTLVLGLTWAWN